MPPGPPQRSSLLLAGGATALGLHPFPAPMAINSVPYDGRPACNNCGFCSHLRLSDPRPHRRPGAIAAGADRRRRAAARVVRVARRAQRHQGHGRDVDRRRREVARRGGRPGGDRRQRHRVVAAGQAVGAARPEPRGGQVPHVPLVHGRLRRLPARAAPCLPGPFDDPRGRRLRRPRLPGRPGRRRRRRPAVLPRRHPRAGRHPGPDRRGKDVPVRAGDGPGAGASRSAPRSRS